MGIGFAPTWLRQVSPRPASQKHFNHCFGGTLDYIRSATAAVQDKTRWSPPPHPASCALQAVCGQFSVDNRVDYCSMRPQAPPMSPRWPETVARKMSCDPPPPKNGQNDDGQTSLIC